MTKTINNPYIFGTKIVTITALLVVFGFSLFVLNHKDSFGVEKTELVATSEKALIVKVHDFKNSHEGQDVTIGKYHEDKKGVWRVNVTFNEFSFISLPNGWTQTGYSAMIFIMILIIILF